MPRQLLGTAIASNTITTTQLQTTVVNQISAGGGPRVSSLIYPGDDTAANTVGGQTVYVTGSGFAANANVYINGNAVPSISFISASNLAITTPALSAATYPVYVINPETGATAIHIPGLRVSGDPTWVTAAGSLAASQDEGSAWSYTVSANSDSAVTYALAGGSSLPTGISLAANGLISGTLSSPPGTETTYNFTVVATDAENQNASRTFSVTVTAGEGVLFANNVLLIHADGTNNKNNHTFLDSSNNNFTITRNGNSTQGTFSPFSQTGWSNLFDATGKYLSVAYSSAAFNLTGDFTVECWINPTNLPSSTGSAAQSYARIWSFGTYNASNSLGLEIGSNDSGFLRRLVSWYNGTQYSLSGNNALAPNQWYHIAVVRSGTTITCYVNGNATGTITGASAAVNRSQPFYIASLQGYESDSSAAFAGYISNLRVLNGTAAYTSNFTPSTTALTAVANTTLLTCNSNRFVDRANTPSTITVASTPSVQAFSPFAPTAAYSTANVGGSGYFDGSGDYLTLPSNDSAFNCGTDSFTLEFWYYDDGTSTLYPNIFGSNDWTSGVGGINIRYNNTGNANKFYVAKYAGNSTPNGGSGVNELMLTANTYAPKCWHHVAFVRNGNNFRIYVNGVKDAETTSTISVDWNLNSAGPRIGGGNWDGANSNIKAYVSGLRLIKGVALYTDNFTPPTAPLTNIANTSLLLNFTNAGIFDQTAKNVIETQGDAKITTSVYKYGTGSIAFDGTGDRLVIPTNKNLDMTNNFTIEMWIYLTTLPAYSVLFDTSANGTAGSNMTELWVESNGNVVYYARGSSILTTNTNNLITANAWHHIAVVKNETSQVLYVNGVSRASATSSTLPNSGYAWHIGDRPASAGSGQYPITGYIDDFRITRDYARYTSNFTPPTSALKDK